MGKLRLRRRAFLLKLTIVGVCSWLLVAIYFTYQESLPSISKAEKPFKLVIEMSDVTPLNSALEMRAVLKPPHFPATGRFGEMGKPVILPSNLSENVIKLVEEGWNKNAFNQYVSDLISVHRTLPDPREDWCKVPGRFSKDLPQTSFIICFHNEAWSVLVRTVHSILERSPPHLVKELILVDDFSDMPHLKRQLDDYMLIYPKVRIIRTKKREGLIRARLLGADHASSDVLTFIDSHCESAPGWLEPLLDRIAKNKKAVVCPVIDLIDDTTFEFYYKNASGVQVGGFDWTLQFKWHPVPDRERKRHKNPSEPVYSPTMAGGLFSIHRDFFEYLGKYDPAFEIWGGENLELSFKTWMCGGTLEIIPCSHVGHIFRKRSPYRWKPGTNVLRRNSIRLAKVWMDDYAKYFFQRIGSDIGDYGEIESRLELRKKLSCKSFQWYLENVYPEQFIPGDAIASGEVRNTWSNMCLDSPCKPEDMHKPAGLWLCHKQGGNQFWMLSKTGEIRRDEACLDYAGEVVMYPCHGEKGNQYWSYNQRTHMIQHGTSKKCLAITINKQKLVMDICNPSSPLQHWKFDDYNFTLAYNAWSLKH